MKSTVRDFEILKQENLLRMEIEIALEKCEILHRQVLTG